MDNANSSTKTYKFNCKMIRTLFRILWIVLKRRLCFILFCLIGLVSLLQEYLVFNVGIVPSGFYQVLVEKSWHGFLTHTLQSFLLILAIALVRSGLQYIANMFYVACRHTLTNELHRYYFQLNRFYYLNNLAYRLTDNPDQRITQDVDKFSEQLSNMVSPILVSPFVIGYYTYECYITTGWEGPVVIFVVFILSIVINKFLIKPVMNMVILQEKCEGFFRFKHMHVRTYAESVALQGGQRAELAQSEKHLSSLIVAQQGLFLRQLPLDMSVRLFDYIGSIVSYLILARPVFMGDYDNLSAAEMGALISKNAFVSIYLISSFSKLVDLSTSVSQIAGLTYRVSELLDLMSAADKQKSVSGRGESNGDGNAPTESIISLPDKTVIELIGVTFGSPSNPNPLVLNLSLKIQLGKDLLVTGNSSSGKTSLLRIIRGLWKAREGTVKRYIKFVPSNTFFLPQKPILTEGSLLHQVVYPVPAYDEAHPRNMFNEKEQIISLLEYVELQHILDKAGGLDNEVDWNWNNMLSPGEAQRLSFVRLFYHKPRLAFLDEATSALSPYMEEKMYKKCKELCITLVTIGHNACLTRYHSLHLHLHGDGGWTLENIN